MRNLIEYLGLFLVVLFFNNNYYFNIIFTCTSIATYLFYIVLYIIKNKNKEKGIKTLIPKKDYLITIILIIFLNLVQVIPFSNIMFGAIINLYFIYYIIKSCIKKDYEFKSNIFESSSLFDAYIVIYLVNMLGSLLIQEM